MLQPACACYCAKNPTSADWLLRVRRRIKHAQRETLRIANGYTGRERLPLFATNPAQNRRPAQSAASGEFHHRRTPPHNDRQRSTTPDRMSKLSPKVSAGNTNIRKAAFRPQALDTTQSGDPPYSGDLSPAAGRLRTAMSLFAFDHPFTPTLLQSCRAFRGFHFEDDTISRFLPSTFPTVIDCVHLHFQVFHPTVVVKSCFIGRR